MKKLLLILFLYLLVEGDNVIGDGLYVYHRGKHAVDELKTKVDEYYPKIEAVDSVLMKTLSAESLQLTAKSTPYLRNVRLSEETERLFTDRTFLAEPLCRDAMLPQYTEQRGLADVVEP